MEGEILDSIKLYHGSILKAYLHIKCFCKIDIWDEISLEKLQQRFYKFFALRTLSSKSSILLNTENNLNSRVNKYIIMSMKIMWSIIFKPCQSATGIYQILYCYRAYKVIYFYVEMFGFASFSMFILWINIHDMHIMAITFSLAEFHNSLQFLCNYDNRIHMYLCTHTHTHKSYVAILKLQCLSFKVFSDKWKPC